VTDDHPGFSSRTDPSRPGFSAPNPATNYGLYQEDARNDGFDDCAELFGKLKQSEREEIQGLVRCLRQHIGESGAGE
jgi:hypothetical protein